MRWLLPWILATSSILQVSLETAGEIHLLQTRFSARRAGRAECGACGKVGSGEIWGGGKGELWREKEKRGEEISKGAEVALS